MKKKMIKKTGLKIMHMFAVILMCSFIVVGSNLKTDTAEAKGSFRITRKIAYSGAVTLKWNKVSGASGYMIYKSDPSTGGFKLIKTTTGLQYDLAGLKSSTSYQFKVAAYVKNNGKNSVTKKTKAVTVKTLKRPKSKLKNVTLYRGSDKYKITDYLGKPIIINYWATWCGPCVEELPDFNSCYRKYGNKVKFIMINCEDRGSLSTVRSFVKRKKFSFPVYYDYAGSFDSAYGQGSIPQTIVVDSKGKILYNEVGMLDSEGLDYIMDYITK